MSSHGYKTWSVAATVRSEVAATPGSGQGALEGGAKFSVASGFTMTSKSLRAGSGSVE